MTNKPTNKILTTTQANYLSKLGWENINMQGAFLNLYPEDFENNTVWEDICNQLGIPFDSESATVLYFATSTKEK